MADPQHCPVFTIAGEHCEIDGSVAQQSDAQRAAAAMGSVMHSGVHTFGIDVQHCANNGAVDGIYVGVVDASSFDESRVFDAPALVVELSTGRVRMLRAAGKQPPSFAPDGPAGPCMVVASAGADRRALRFRVNMNERCLAVLAPGGDDRTAWRVALGPDGGPQQLWPQVAPFVLMAPKPQITLLNMMSGWLLALTCSDRPTVATAGSGAGSSASTTTTVALLPGLPDASPWAPTSEAHGRFPEPAKARALDLVLLGHLLSTHLVAAREAAETSEGDSTERNNNNHSIRSATTVYAKQLRSIWTERIVPHVIWGELDWALGTTACIAGLQSAAAQGFNGFVGRVSNTIPIEGRWEVLVDGPEGVGTVNLRPRNLVAPRRVADVLKMWRRIPNASQVKEPTPANGTKAAPPPRAPPPAIDTTKAAASQMPPATAVSFVSINTRPAFCPPCVDPIP